MTCRLDRNGKLDEVSPDKKQKVAMPAQRQTTLQDFAGPNPLRASKVLGPISRFRVVKILPHMNLVPIAGLCTAHRFHTEGKEQTCRVGCLDEPGSLTLFTTSVLSCTIWLPLFGDSL